MMMKRMIRGIKALHVAFVIIPIATLWIALEDVWDWTIGSRIRNKSK
jgi:hypothetical protein